MGLISFIIKWVFILFIALLLIGLGAGVYLYYFHTFKTIRICVPEQSNDLNISCTSSNQCLNMLKSNSFQSANLLNLESQISTAPEFMKPAIASAVDATLYCQTTCRLRPISDSPIIGIKKAETCKEGELEVAKVKLHGKELIQFLNFIKNKVI